MPAANDFGGDGARPIHGPAPVDALIVGAGVIGLSCAWRLAQRGLRVRVLEREAAGTGASRVAAGMLAPVGEATWGEEALLTMAITSHRAWPGFAAELAELTDLDVGYQAIGALHVALDRDEAEELRRRYELMRELGLEAEWLRPSGCRRLEPGLSTGCTAGVLAPHEAAADPPALIAALRYAAELSGVELIAPAEPNAALIEGDRLVGVLTANEDEHRASVVVLAAGAWSGASGWLPREARPPIRPVKGQILTLHGSSREPLCSRIVASEHVYIVPRGDGRLVVGATVEEQGFDVRVTAGGVFELLREAYRALPDVVELELVDSEAGLRPGSPDNAPLVGAGGITGLVLATGHFRNGILLAPVTAEAVAAVVTGERPAAELVTADPGRFADHGGLELVGP